MDHRRSSGEELMNDGNSDEVVEGTEEDSVRDIQIGCRQIPE